MTVHVALGTAVAGSGLVAQNTGEGVQWLPPTPQKFGTHRYYNRRVGGMWDDLLDLNPKDERELAKARGRLNGSSSVGTGGSTTPTIGIAQAKLISEAALIAGGSSPLTGANLTWVRMGTSSSQLSLPLAGLMDPLEWVLLWFINPRSTDLVAANTSFNFLMLDCGTGPSQQSLIVQYNASSVSAGTLTATLQYWDFVQNHIASWTASVSLVPGDFPSSAAGPICLSFDTTSGLIATAGSALKQAIATTSGAPVASRLLPWFGTLYITNNNAQTDHGVDFTIPQIGRWSNNSVLFGPDNGAAAGSGITPGAGWRFRQGPALTVNASSTGSAWPKHIGGLKATYTGNALTALGAAGCPMIRIGRQDESGATQAPIGSFPYATITSVTALRASTAAQRANGGGASPSAIGMDFTNFDPTVLAHFNHGIDIHAGFNGIPTLLQGAAGANGPPASNSDLALWASVLIGRYVYLQGQATPAAGIAATGQIVDAIFWNEPDQGIGAWNDALDQNAVAFIATNCTITGTSVTGATITASGAGSTPPQNGMGVYVPGGMGSGVPTISGVSGTGTGPYSFTLSTAATNGAGIMIRGLPPDFVATYLACANQIHSDSPSFPVLNGPDGKPLSFGIQPQASTQPFSWPWWEACAWAAKGAGLTPTTGLTQDYHDYYENSNITRANGQVMTYLAGLVGLPSQQRVPEWDIKDGQSLLHLGDSVLNWDFRWTEDYVAAYIHAFIADRVADGVDMGAYFAPWGISKTGAGNPAALFDAQADSAHTTGQWLGNGKPTPAYYAFELIWKHHNGVTSPLISPVASNYPNLRGMCSVGTGSAGKTVITLSYSSFRPAGGTSKDRFKFHIDWSLAAGLPTNFTWKQWQVDETTRNLIGRVPLLAQDGSSNAPNTLPYELPLDWMGVGCIQIIGS